jgi:LysR family transcriptional regulator, low CO2-responsive transcriptional regulator
VLTLHQLEVFVAVAEEVSVGRAASRLHVSQPAVSSTMASLQREVGVDLVERDGRGIQLTPAGKELFRYASLVLGLVDEGLQSVRSLSELAGRPIRIGATSSLVTHVVAPILSRLRDHDPSLQFALEIGDRSNVWKDLENHRTDVALSTAPPSMLPFASVATMQNSFVVVGRPGSVWAGRLDQITWLVREAGATTRAASDEVIARLGINPPTLVISTDDAIRGSIEAGLGIGVLSLDAVAEAIRKRELIVVPTPATPMPQPWHLLIRRGDETDERVMRFLTDFVHADERLEWTAYGIEWVSDRPR